MGLPTVEDDVIGIVCNSHVCRYKLSALLFCQYLGMFCLHILYNIQEV